MSSRRPLGPQASVGFHHPDGSGMPTRGESHRANKHLFLEANIFAVKARVLMMAGIKKESFPGPPWLTPMEINACFSRPGEPDLGAGPVRSP